LLSILREEHEICWFESYLQIKRTAGGKLWGKEKARTCASLMNLVAQVVQYRELSEQRLRLLNLFQVHLVSGSGF